MILFAAAGMLSCCMENRYVGIRQVGIQSMLFNVLDNTLRLFFNRQPYLATLLKHLLVPKSSDHREKPVWLKNTGLELGRTEFFSYRYSPSLSLSWKQRSFSYVNQLASYWWKVILKGSWVKTARKQRRIYSFWRQIQCMSQNFGTSKIRNTHRRQKLSHNLFSILQREEMDGWMDGELEVIFWHYA